MYPSNPFLGRAGLVLIVCSLAFVAVFTYLATTFGYPDVLERSAAEVLPALMAGGSVLRNVWFLYGALPLGVILAGVASAALLERGGASLRTLGVAASTVAGVAMMLGLLRWPTIMTTLARHWGDATPPAQAALAAGYDAANLFLGNLIGELVGEVGLATWFVALGIAFRRDGRRRLGTLGVGAGGLVAAAALRNVTDVVAPIAALNDVTLPLWLLTLGIVFLRDGRGAVTGRPRLTNETRAASAPSSA
jgi:hypothetical protein